MVQIKWTFQALNDLKNIADYISVDSKTYAKLQIERIKNATRILKHQSKIGRKVPELNKENIRELIEGNYRIIYRIVNQKQVDIITIPHTSRNFRHKQI